MLRVWLLEEEYELLKNKADKSNKNMSEYIRSIILYGASSRSVVKYSKEDSENIRYELNRIGNNINQIAYRVNGKGKVNVNDFDDLYTEFVEYINVFTKYTMD